MSFILFTNVAGRAIFPRRTEYVFIKANGSTVRTRQAVMLVPYRGLFQAVKQVVVLAFKAGAIFADKGLLVLRGL